MRRFHLLPPSNLIIHFFPEFEGGSSKTRRFSFATSLKQIFEKKIPEFEGGSFPRLDIFHVLPPPQTFLKTFSCFFQGLREDASQLDAFKLLPPSSIIFKIFVLQSLREGAALMRYIAPSLKHNLLKIIKSII
jgi:hypothetical protein